MNRLLIAVLLLLILASCKEKKVPLFKPRTSAETGINFNNQIVESDMLNMLNYQYLYNGGGVGIGDFNNDSLPDIYFTSSLQSNKLFINRGHLKFEDVTDRAGVGGEKKWSRGATVVDINNDGLLDIYVCAAAWQNAELKKDVLYVNKGVDESTGIPRFVESAQSYGLVDTVSTHMASFFDYDNDGDLDLYLVVNDLNQEYPSTFRKIKTDGTGFTNDKLYRNDWNPMLQHPVYKDVTKEAGITWEGNGLGISILDINKDGWKDIYVSNDYLSGNILYVNNRNGTFSNRVQEYFKHGSLNAMGNDAGDINNDGLTDLVEMDMMPEDHYRRNTMMSPVDYNWYLYSAQYNFPYQVVRNTLQLNQGPRLLPHDSIGEPIFSEIAYYSGVPATDWSWAALLMDADNDGYKDLMTTNGLPKDVTDLDFIAYRDQNQSMGLNTLLQKLPPVQISNYIFQNNQALGFVNKTDEWGWNFPTFSAGIAYADFDRDGDLDVVINNTNMEASFLENQSEKSAQKKNYLNLKFRGDTSNINGIGTVVTIFYKGQVQTAENTPYHGYMSSMENMLHFGLDTIQQIDSIVIDWPNGKSETMTSVAVNQTMLISQSAGALLKQSNPIQLNNWFSNITYQTGINYLPKETDYVDFNIQRQLPHKYSQYGPAIAAGDVNGDGLSDIIVGGTAPTTAVLYLQQSNQQFIQQPFSSIATQTTDDASIALFDADNDKDLDCYIATGGAEYPKNDKRYADRFYINDGKGHFQLDTNAIPLIAACKSIVRAADYDKDGDLDLFVGGRIIPGEYPKPENGYLLCNESKNGTVKFNLVTNEIAPELKSIGLITDAIWNDADKDGDLDLTITGEWMGILFFKNEKGKLIKQTTTTDQATGWWNRIVAADLDKDGDLDYVVGNTGTNGLFHGTAEEPVSVYANDFDGNQRWDALLSLWRPGTLHGPRQEYPAANRDQLTEEMPAVKKQFPDYTSYAKSDIKTVLAPFVQIGSMQLKATQFNTVWIENKGAFQFEIHVLPAPAQWSPVYGITVNDYNADGFPDIVLIGNEYAMNPALGRYDASNGLVLQGNGKGVFSPLSILQSGIYLPGNTKDLLELPYAGGTALLAAQNGSPLQFFVQKQIKAKP